MSNLLTEKQRTVLEAVSVCGGNKTAAARLLKMSRGALRTHLKRIDDKIAADQPRINKNDEMEITLPHDEIDPEQLWRQRMDRYEQKRRFEESRDIINIKVNDPLPIALHVFGDPHVDDDGCDLPTLDAHTDLILRTPGMWAGNAGDTTNNWVGRLSRLYAQQGTSAAEAWALAEHWITRLKEKWLFLIGGNHDLWSGAGDPLKWICRASHAMYTDSQIRMRFQFPGGNELMINARHDFAGKSQWNPAHGSMKAAMMGFHDDLLLNGHKHVSGYGLIKCPATGKISHCVQVASYKRWDQFSRDKGFPDQHISPSATFILNPQAGHPGEYVKLYWCPYEAADVLGFLRKRYAE